MKYGTITSVLAMGAAMLLCGGTLVAQDKNSNGGGPGGPGGGPWGSFDPAQFRQRMMEQIRTTLSVTNDEEWTVIESRVLKVMETRRDSDMGGGMRMGGPGGPPPGGGPPGGPGGRGGFGPQASEEQKALQKALDDKAPAQAIKDALARFRASRKEKQEKLAAAQADLRGVLTTRQEAGAVLMGLLP